MIGTTIGPYQVVAKLGAGGMGEVYRARDTRLERNVAIKVLGADFARDADRVRRFTVEAQATGALNHPNILAVYDIGTHDGAPYLVTELLEGETLRARMDADRIPLSKALELARQVASGLAAAHAKGITHRDIKPENLFVTADGRAKILDFGLAKAAASAGATADDPTRLNAATSAGIVMGTVGYMSPEQVRGETADPRSDIFSFGIVLYELLSGKRPFIGDTAVQTMNAILTEDPPEIVTTPRALPPALDRVVRHCLEKKPDERFQSARDLAFALDALSSSSTSSTSSGAIGAVAVRPARRRLLPIAAASTVSAVLTLAVLAFFRTSPSQLDGYRFEPFSIESGGQERPRWSPDGAAVAYSGAENPLASRQVYVRHLDQPVAQKLTSGPGHALVVGWMADGQRIIFQRGNALFSVASVGGVPEPLLFADAPALSPNNPLALSPDGTVLATLRRGEDGLLGIWTSSPVGQPFERYEPAPFATVTNLIPRLLEFSPDGRQILLTLPSDSPARYWLMPYPASATNPPRPVFNDVTDITGWSWMPDNRHVILAAGANLRDAGRLWTAELRSGERHALTDGSSNFDSVALSPDGRQLVAVERANRSSVVQMDLTTAAASRLIASERISEGAAWAADVPVMAYVTQRSGGPEIWLHTPGSRDRPLVTAANAPPGETNYFLLPAPSPTGDRVIYSRVQNQQTGAGAARLWIASTSGGPSVPLTNTTDLEIPGSWSPDGNWFVYLGINEAAPSLMMVRTSGQATPVVLKAPVGGEIPAWSPDGQWIKYQMLDGSDHLISQDGVRTRELGNPPSIAWAFSRNSRRLFGIRREGDRAVLFALDVATGAQAVIGPTSWEDYGPGGRMTPGVRFSLAPDGESLVYGTYREHKNLWLMEGFEPERGLLSRLGLR